MKKKVTRPKTVPDMIRRADELRIGEVVPQDFKTALSFYKRAADRGNPRAQYMTGAMYESGHGVRQSYRNACRWYEKAAENGDHDAMVSLAFMYEMGFGTKRSRPLAIEWLEKAAEAGDPRAHGNLGRLYLDRALPEFNAHAAMTWLQKGNLEGFAPAQCNLAKMYIKGLAVERQCSTAATILKRAARQGNATSKRILAELYRGGLGIERSVSVANHLYIEAARWGDRDSREILAGKESEDEVSRTPSVRPSDAREELELGLAYLDGVVLPQSAASAMYWLEKAFADREPEAALVLGQILENGWGVDKSHTVAESWYRKGTRAGSGPCAYCLGYMHEYGIGTPEAPAKAYQYYFTAADRGSDDDLVADADYAMAELHLSGKGAELSDDKAVENYRAAAALGHAGAQHMLGALRLEGRGGVTKDEARIALEAALAQGDPDAEDMLDRLRFPLYPPCDNPSMAMVDIIYTHPGEIKVEPGCEIRRTSVQEMVDYVNGLVFEMKWGGVNVKFESKLVEGCKSDIQINGLSVEEILDGLEIKTPEVEPEQSDTKIITFERSPDDWDRRYVEDISDILLKNAISKAYADAVKNNIM